MRILLCVGEGLGNIIETLPLAKTLHYNEIPFDVLNLGNIPTDTAKWLFEAYAPVTTDLSKGYTGRIELATSKGNLKNSERIDIPLINDADKQDIYKPNVNEIEVYLSVAEDLGLKLPEDVYDVDLSCYDMDKGYDVVVHNGCSLQNPSEWQRKKYPGMEELVAYLEGHGLRVASIGASAEYSGGVKETGLDLRSSASIIKNSKLFISNDTGTYHLAAAMKKQGIVLFTATSTIKNYHPTFHRTIKVVTAGVECQPCQFHDTWNKCSASTYNNWKCRDIPVSTVVKEIENVQVLD